VPEKSIDYNLQLDLQKYSNKVPIKYTSIYTHTKTILRLNKNNFNLKDTRFSVRLSTINYLFRNNFLRR